MHPKISARKNQKNLRASQCSPAPNIRTYQNISELLELWKLKSQLRSKCSNQLNQRWNRLTSWTTGSSRPQPPKCLGSGAEIHAARPTLTASATAPRKTWTTRPEPDRRCQVAPPSRCPKFSHCLLIVQSCLPKCIAFIIFHHFLHHLSSFVIGMLDSPGNSPGNSPAEAVPARTALWGSVVHGVDVGDGWCRRSWTCWWMW